MRVLFDTNVILDVLLKRAPFEADARWLVNQVEQGHVAGLLGSTTVTTIHYVASKALGGAKTRRDLRSLFQIFEVAAVGREVLQDALDAGFADYEDGVLHEAARRAGAAAIVTRNAPDFEAATLDVYTPEDLRTRLAA